MKMRCAGKVVCLSFFVVSGCFGANIEELRVQVASKKEQLRVLGEKIREADEAMEPIRQKVREFGLLYGEAKTRQFLSENPGKTPSEKDLKDIADAFDTEWCRFAEKCMDIKNKTNKCIVNDAFFGWIARGTKDVSIFKFYMIQYAYDRQALHALLSEWENLNDEYLALLVQLDIV